MSVAAWVLVVASHVQGGAQVQFQEFDTQQACNTGAVAARSAVSAAGGEATAKCTPKGGAGF